MVEQTRQERCDIFTCNVTGPEVPPPPWGPLLVYVNRNAAAGDTVVCRCIIN